MVKPPKQRDRPADALSEAALKILDRAPDAPADPGDDLREPATFNVEERRKQKQRDREADIAAVDRGEITGEELNARNGFFSSLDRSKVRIVEWRKKIKLD